MPRTQHDAPAIVPWAARAQRPHGWPRPPRGSHPRRPFGGTCCRHAGAAAQAGGSSPVAQALSEATPSLAATCLPGAPPAPAHAAAAGMQSAAALGGGWVLPPTAAAPFSSGSLLPALLQQVAEERQQQQEQQQRQQQQEQRRREQQRQQAEGQDRGAQAAAASCENGAGADGGVAAPAAAAAAGAERESPVAMSNWMRVVGVCAGAALLMYATRTSISTAIVPMAEQFGWDKTVCSAVLSAFFAGYSVTQILGGQLSDRYGGGAVLGGGVALWSLCALLTPAAAASGEGALLAARAGLGLAQGVAFPAIHALLARGVPVGRRSAAIGGIMAMAHCGTALAFGLSPSLIQASGWGLPFYVFGGLAVLWALPWMRMMRERQAAAGPAAAPAQTQQQQQQWGQEQQQQEQKQQWGQQQQEQQQQQKQKQQWGQQQQEQQQQEKQQQHQQRRRQDGVGFWPLLRRREVWAIAVTQYAGAFGFYALLAWLPSFFLEHGGLQLSQLGGYTLVPYLLQAAVGASSGLLADHLIHRRGWPVRSVRVAMQVAAMLGPAAALTLATSPYGAHSAQAALAFITLGMGMSALTSSGVSASHLDIAPRHAGLVFSIGNTAGTLAGLVAVPATGYVLHTTGSWSLAFGLAAMHNVAGAAVWAAWAGGRRLEEDGGDDNGDDDDDGNSGRGGAGGPPGGCAEAAPGGELATGPSGDAPGAPRDKSGPA